MHMHAYIHLHALHLLVHMHIDSVNLLSLKSLATLSNSTYTKICFVGGLLFFLAMLGVEPKHREW